MSKKIEDGSVKLFKYWMVVVFFWLALTNSVSAETLKVGLYPYVPRMEQFADVLQSEWSKVHPEIGLDIATREEWDGGYDSEKSPDNLDVFVFDALFLNEYRAQDLLEPLTPTDINPSGIGDFVHYAIEGVKNEDNLTYAGIPIFGCTNVLFYKNNLDIEATDTFDEVRDIVKTCQFTGLVPGQSPYDGMMLDISGKTTNAAYYLATQYAMDGTYPFPTPDTISSDVTDRLRILMTMSSYENAITGFYKTEDNKYGDYQRGYWFGEGYGNSFVGFTEAMWGVANGNGGDLPSDFSFMPLPLWNTGETTDPVFYADVIGVNAKRPYVEDAKKLAAFLGSKDFVVKSSTGVGQSDGVPQYLLLTLESAYDELAMTYPVYSTMKAMASNPGIKMFTLSNELYEWVENNKEDIRTNIRTGFSCGCDEPTTTYLTSANAPSVCTPLCENQGGWNGQWTTADPYVPESYESVCGCNACLTPSSPRSAVQLNKP